MKKTVLLISSLLLTTIVLMFVFKICPPSGPWPMPPWCTEQGLISKGEATNLTTWLTIPYTYNNSVKLIKENQSITMNKTGLLSYQTIIPVKGQETINYHYQVNNETSINQELRISESNQVTYDYVTLDFKPDLNPNFEFGVNMFDTWGRNYNFLMFENTRDHITESMKRVKQAGAQKVIVHDFLMTNESFALNNTDYKIINEVFSNDFRDEAMTQADLNELATNAHENNLTISWRVNLHFINIGELIGTDISNELTKVFNEFNQPKSKEWVTAFFQAYEQALINRAIMLNQAGFNELIITPSFMNPRFHPHESLANELWKDLIKKVSHEFNGEVGVIIDRYGFLTGTNDGENWTKYDYYKLTDNQYYSIYNLLSDYDSFNNYLQDLNNKAREEGINLTIISVLYSYEGAVNKLPVEFNEVNNPAIKSLTRDWQHQANNYELLLQSLEGKDHINGLIMGGYWWDNAMNPDSAITRIDISPSTRNKPAEAVFQKWSEAYLNN